MSYKRFDQEDITISAESIVLPAWSNQQLTLSTFLTSSQVSLDSGRFYYNIFRTGSTDPEFSITYGDKLGSGSLLFEPTVVGKSPSATIYGQYRTLINGDENTDFNFVTQTSTSITVLAVNRSRFKERLKPGSLSLVLSSGSQQITLTDNSQAQTTVQYTDAGRVYELVSGSAGTVYTGNNAFGYVTATSASYGKLLPDVGLIILNNLALTASVANGGLAVQFNTASNSNSPSNLSKVYNLVKEGGALRLQSEETITSNYIFTRVRNSEYNYSTNPSNLDANGELVHDIMINTPQAYITAVGMYNDENELLAVAKLSRPLLKDFTKEALVRIKLDY